MQQRGGRLPCMQQQPLHSANPQVVASPAVLPPSAAYCALLLHVRRHLIGSNDSSLQGRRRRGPWRSPRSPRAGAYDSSAADDLQLPAAGGIELQTDEVVIGLERDVRPHL